MSVDSETMRQLADLQQRLTRAEEQLLAGDPRVAEALETARAALSSAESATQAQAAISKLERALAEISTKIPRSRGVSAADPEVPDPNEPQNQNAPDLQDPPATAATPPASTSAVPPLAAKRRRRIF